MRRLRSVLGARLVAAWVVGSSALGDFDAARSDVDVQALAAERPSPDQLKALASELSAVPCPVRGLEFVLYARDELPAFALNLNTGPGMEHHEGYDPRAEERFWFVLDLAIAREHARPLAGPHPREVVPAPNDGLIRAALRESLAWYRGYGGAQALFAACRARAWLATGHWLSKGEAARWAREHDPEAIDAALATRTDPGAPGPTPEQVERALRAAEAEL